MRFRSAAVGSLALAFTLVAACREGGSDSGPENLALAVRLVVGSGELRALEVPEFSQDGTDLNGDGDVLDNVLHVIDLDTGALRDLGLAAGAASTSVGEVLVAFVVSESGQGDQDLNGDGDTLDLVVHVYDSGTGVTTNTGLATLPLAPTQGLASTAFLVIEESQDASDLNGDGDTLDLVLHVYDARTQLTRNTERAATTGIVFHDHAYAIGTDEPSAAADLNGDGDITDPYVFELYDLLLGGMEQTPVAMSPDPLAVGVDDWVVLTSEPDMQLDLDGDGDQLDGVWQEVDPHGGAQTPIGYSSGPGESSIADGTVLGLIAMEVDGRDANGDGDFLDRYAVLHDPPHDQTFTSDRALGSLPLALAGDFLAFAVNETQENADLNGDLDLADDVLHTLEVANGDVVNHGFAVAGLQAVGSVLVLWLDESEDGLDRNGDGDALDLVLTKFDPEFLLVSNLGLASSPPLLGVAGTRALVSVPEADQGLDLNGDGDELDLVAYRLEVVFPIDPPAPDFTRLPLAISSTSAALLPDGRGLLLVSETDQGTDLNADGDLFDAVLHRFE